MRTPVCVVALLALAGCVAIPGVRAPEATAPGALHLRGYGALADPTVRGARLVPLDLAQARVWGVEPGGGRRAIAAGVRVVDEPDGRIVASVDRFPSPASGVVVVPERMGGGYLYTLGSSLWRSDSWLGVARPLTTAPDAIASVQVGLDRVYLRTQKGALGALDPRTGAPEDLGPVPRAPVLGKLAALDAWRAVAVADLRGAMLTLDAGSTWRPLRLPIDPTEVLPLPEAIAVGGMGEQRQVEWWEVRPDGRVGRLVTPPPGGGPEAHPGADARSAQGPAERPLAAAVEDGWPLADGTALVARDGALTRVRLADGGVVESAADAYPFKPSRCHAVGLGHSAEPGAFGFTCGEPHGGTRVYAMDLPRGALVELARFERPRVVLASGNGALAVRGGCAPGAGGDAAAGRQRYCLRSPGGAWREIDFVADDVDLARVAVLADGRVAVLRGPRDGDLSTARLTLTDGARTTDVPLVWPELRADTARALRLGLWMDGVEERRPGILGAWVELAGAVVGVEVSLDGRVEVGEYIHDAGSPFVSGRYAFGWTASRRGFESIDGGMTWTKDIDLPDPIEPVRAVQERACGPIGCLVAGWMRIGWGAIEPKVPVHEGPRGPRPSAHEVPPLELACEPTGGKPPPGPPTPPPTLRLAPPPVLSPVSRPWMGVIPITAPCQADAGTFQGHPGPAYGPQECGFRVEVGAASGTVRANAWGPRSGDWDSGGHWKIAWSWPWGGWPDARASAPMAAPWPTRDQAARYLAFGTAASPAASLLPGDDADHALLVLRRGAGARLADVVVLEADRPALTVQRPGGEPMQDVQAATRVAGRWYLATGASPGELPAIVLWSLDGAVAREVVRVPRSGTDVTSAVRLARRADGAALALVIDGQPGLDRAPPMRWIVPVDLDSGGVSDPEPSAALEPADPSTLLCTGDDPGWVVDLPYGSALRVRIGGTLAPLQSPVARVRLSRAHSCLERFAGSLDRLARAEDVLTTPSAHIDGRSLNGTAIAQGTRFGLRCAVAH